MGMEKPIWPFSALQASTSCWETETGVFSPPSATPPNIGPSISSIVAGDFNNDGKLDVAFTNANSATIGVLIGNGDGTFQNEQDYVAAGDSVFSILTSDFNQDQKLDLAVTTSSGNVNVLHGNGDGTFAGLVSYSISSASYQIPIAASVDFNEDGKAT